MKLLEVEECLLVSQAMMGEEPRVAEQITRSTGLVPRAKKETDPQLKRGVGSREPFLLFISPFFKWERVTLV